MAEITRRGTPLHSTRRNVFGQINVAIIGVTYYFSQQEQHTSSSCHAVVAFIVTVLLNFLQLKYQGKNISPFETHPKSVGVSIASLIMYCFAYDAELRSPFASSHRRQTYAFIARRGMALFGSLASVSLASILFPHSLGPVLYSLYILFSAGELLRHRLQRLWNWFYQKIMGRLPLILAFSDTRAIPPRPQV